MSATLQDPDSRATRSTRNISIALIGPHMGRRSVVAKAVSGTEGRTIREFAAYPDKVSELPRLLQQGFDVVMIDLDSDQNCALQLVQEIAAYGTVNVIVYSSRNDPTLGMISTNAGASDFLPIPADSAGEDRPGPQPVPDRAAAPVRPVDVRPETRVSESGFSNEANGHLRAQKFGVNRSDVPPSISNQQNVSPVRPAAPASVRAPEMAPRPAAMTEPAPRAVPEPRSIPPQAPPVQATIQRPVQSPIQSPVQRPVQSPVPSPVQSPSQRPVQIPAAAQVRTPAASPAPSPVQQSAPMATARAGGIETDADVLELFKYGKGEVKNIKDPDELPVPKTKKWVFISVGSFVVIAVVALLVFLGVSHRKNPAPPSAPQVASDSLNTAASGSAGSAAPAIPVEGQPIAKPSPSGAIEDTDLNGTAKPVRQVSSAMMDAQLTAKSKISRDIKRTNPTDEPPPAGMAPVSMDSGGGVKDAALGGFGKVNVVPVVSQVSAGVAEGMAIHKTAPVYPKIARDSRVSGTVVLGATINRSGMLENVHAISGSQMLRGAAIDAVKTWRYRPYMLNNQPVAVQTTINVVFTLGKD
jgi:protein TonB